MAVHRRRPLRGAMRLAVLERDDWTCRYCGFRPEHSHVWRWRRWRATLHIDHVIPVSAGGHNTISNLVTACERCNLAKHAQLWPDWIALVHRLERQDADLDAARFIAAINEAEAIPDDTDDVDLVNV